MKTSAAFALVAVCLAGEETDAFAGPSMGLFGNNGAASARPTAGAAKAGSQKTAVAKTSGWTGPAVQRRAQYVAQRDEQRVQPPAVNKRNLTGTFTYEQMVAFEDARRSVASGSSRYWEQIAAKVPGQTAETCKRMAETRLFEKAAGTQANFFGSYVEVKEVKDYVDQDADVMGKLMGLFSRK